jgi:hypothetical protein
MVVGSAVVGSVITLSYGRFVPIDNGLGIRPRPVDAGARPASRPSCRLRRYSQQNQAELVGGRVLLTRLDWENAGLRPSRARPAGPPGCLSVTSMQHSRKISRCT